MVFLSCFMQFTICGGMYVWDITIEFSVEGAHGLTNESNERRIACS